MPLWLGRGKGAILTIRVLKISCNKTESMCNVLQDSNLRKITSVLYANGCNQVSAVDCKRTVICSGKKKQKQGRLNAGGISDVGIVTWLRDVQLTNRGLTAGRSKQKYLAHSLQTYCRVQWDSCPVGIGGAGGIGRDINHSPPPSTQVMNIWTYTSTPHMSAWHGP
jgi:hypothetical protein